MAKPAEKKTKLTNGSSSDELAKAASTAWEHYRNYNESYEDTSDGDVDELEELLTVVLKPHMDANAIQPLKSLKDLSDGSISALLPVLISVAYFHMADLAIGDYLEQKQKEDGSEKELAERLAKCQQLVEQSLHWYPENASMWSMAANFGRMFQVLSPAAVCQWYEKAVDSAVIVREEALKMVEDEETAPEAKEWIELLLLNNVAGVEYVVDEEDEDEEKEIEIVVVEKGEEEEKPDKNTTTKKRKAEEEEEEDIENEDDNEEGYFSTSSVEATARFMAAMLHSTAGQQDTAKQHLQHFPVTHRVHPNVWQPPASSDATDKTEQVTKYQSPDGILPKPLYERLCHVFAPKAAYWQESDYNHRGYYSYYMDKPKEKANATFKVTNLMDDIMWNHLFPLMKPDNEIVGAEWWVHTRAIQANLGHNLHFDTDEALLAQEAQITHPVYSSVLYLTGGETGGATIVFDQSPDSETVAEKAWRCVPEDNSVMVFDGNLLHGVLPCPGVAKAKIEENATTSIKEQWISEEAAKEGTPHRLTLLVGFWTRRVPDKMKNRRLYGPCGPLPPRPTENGKDDQQHTWVEEIHRGYSSNTEPAKRQPTITTKEVPAISPAWETLKPTAEETDDTGDGPSLLDIPQGIDHRFFVQNAPRCFRDSLFERNEDDEGEDEAGC